MFRYILNTPLTLFVIEVWVDKEPISLICMKNQQKNQSVSEQYRCGKCEAIDKNVECSCCDEVKAVEFFELLGMKYSDINAVTQRV